MQIITTTELRTKSKRLVQVLKEGKSVDLIHRSQIVGKISPIIREPKLFDAEKFLEFSKKLNLPVLSYKERERRYREAMEKKHGKSFS